MSEIKLSDEDIKRIAGEVIKTLTLGPIRPYINPQAPMFSTWRTTPTPGLPDGGQVPYSSFV